MSLSPVSVPVTKTVSEVTVSSAAGGAGASLSFPGEWSYAYVRNVGSQDCEYSTDGGTTWLTLQFRSVLAVEYATASGGVKVRKSRNSENASLVVEAYDLSEAFTTGDGGVLALTELTDPVNITASGVVRNGPGEYCGFIVRAGVGFPQTATLYDALSATGVPIKTETITGLGYYPWAGNKVRPCTVGLYATITGGTSRQLEFP